MNKDTPSYDELREDHAQRWKVIGQIRDQRYQMMKAMLARPWRCPVCGTQNKDGGVCPKCREARLIEVE